MRKWMELEAEHITEGPGGKVLRACAKKLGAVEEPLYAGAAEIARIRNAFLERALETETDVQAIRVIISCLCDLRGQGWEITSRRRSIAVRKPAPAADHNEEKARIRAGLLVERDRQLAEEPVRRFVRSVERRRLGPSGWSSIFSLMRSGPELAEQLRVAARMPRDDRPAALREIIQPYVQPVDDSSCRFTGLALKDIWRYFRYTWVSPHKTVPGRNLWFLIRDAAVENHPVIGIAALGSPFVQMRVRDRWLGWSRKEFLAELQEKPSAQWARWLESRLNELIGAIYTEDLRKDGLLRDDDLKWPDSYLIEALREVAAEERTKHRRFGSAQDHKGESASSLPWAERARTPLFTWKRTSTLADLLEARLHLQEAGFTSPCAEGLSAALSSPSGRKAIGRILRRVKAAHVGHEMADITICGAVAPYNHILGGKLVALLLASPEVKRAYEERYARSASVIGSSMAGRPLFRAPRLVFMGTTSLYGVGSSQYNRLRLPPAPDCEHWTGEIRYEELGVTEGYGSFHFSDETMREIRMLIAQRNGGRTVRYIFGEGVNPRMREVRGALEQVGLPADQLLRHGTPRIVYGVSLAENVRDVLLGRSKQPRYIVPSASPAEATRYIVDYWIGRWLSMRIEKERILDQVAAHGLSYPVTHGARVRLPPLPEDPAQLSISDAGAQGE